MVKHCRIYLGFKGPSLGNYLMYKPMIALFFLPISAWAVSYCPTPDNISCDVSAGGVCQIDASGWQCNSCGGYQFPKKTMNALVRVTWSGKTESSQGAVITCHYAWQTERGNMKVSAVVSAIVSDNQYPWSDVERLSDKGEWHVYSGIDPVTGQESYSASCPASSSNAPISIQDCPLPERQESSEQLQF